MTIRKINNPIMKRVGVTLASDYFKNDDIPGWMMVNSGGASYYGPDEWELEPEYTAIYVANEDLAFLLEDSVSNGYGDRVITTRPTSYTIRFRTEKPQ